MALIDIVRHSASRLRTEGMVSIVLRSADSTRSAPPAIGEQVRASKRGLAAQMRPSFANRFTLS
jgi:hypothetical protein